MRGRCAEAGSVVWFGCSNVGKRPAFVYHINAIRLHEADVPHRKRITIAIESLGGSQK